MCIEAGYFLRIHETLHASACPDRHPGSSSPVFLIFPRTPGGDTAVASLSCFVDSSLPETEARIDTEAPLDPGLREGRNSAATALGK